MYSYNNSQKHNSSMNKKLAGPNSARVNPYMAPKAYQQANWMSRPQAEPMTAADFAQNPGARGLGGYGSDLMWRPSQTKTPQGFYGGILGKIAPNPNSPGFALLENPGGQYAAQPRQIKYGPNGEMLEGSQQAVNEADAIAAAYGVPVDAQSRNTRPQRTPESLMRPAPGPAPSKTPPSPPPAAAPTRPTPKQPVGMADIFGAAVSDISDALINPGMNDHFNILDLNTYGRLRDLRRQEGERMTPGMTKPDPATGMVDPGYVPDWYDPNYKSPNVQQPSEAPPKTIDVASPEEGSPPRPQPPVPQGTRERLQSAPYDQLAEAARAYGIDVPQSSMTPEQIAEMDAQTNATLANVDKIRADAMARGAAPYAPRTELLRKEADNMAGRTNRAESYLRDEMGPRVPIDASGPYAFDSQGKIREGRVNSTYDMGAPTQADQDRLAAMQKDGDAFRAKRAENDAKLQDELKIADPTKMKRDAQKFSADFQIYKRGGGSMNIRDYIMARAKEKPFDDDMRRLLENNYGVDLSSQDLEKAPVDSDISTARQTAMDDAASRRSAEQERRTQARATLNEQAARRGEIDRLVAADRAAGYYNTRPMREAQKTQQENMQRAMEYDRQRQAAELQGNIDVEKARGEAEAAVARAGAEADAAAWRRQYDMANEQQYWQTAGPAKASIQEKYPGDNLDDPTTRGGMEWKQWKDSYVGPKPPGAMGGPAAPADEAAASRGRVNRMNMLIEKSDDPNILVGAPIEVARKITEKATKEGLTPSEVIQVLSAQPGGLDLKDPRVVMQSLKDITKEMNDWGVALADSGGYSYNDITRDIWREGRKQMQDRYAPLLKVLASIVGQEAVDEQLRKIGIRQWWLYEGATHSPGSATGFPQSVARGVVGGN